MCHAYVYSTLSVLIAITFLVLALVTGPASEKLVEEGLQWKLSTDTTEEIRSLEEEPLELEQDYYFWNYTNLDVAQATPGTKLTVEQVGPYRIRTVIYRTNASLLAARNTYRVIRRTESYAVDAETDRKLDNDILVQPSTTYLLAMPLSRSLVVLGMIVNPATTATFFGAFALVGITLTPTQQGLMTVLFTADSGANVEALFAVTTEGLGVSTLPNADDFAAVGITDQTQPLVVPLLYSFVGGALQAGVPGQSDPVPAISALTVRETMISSEAVVNETNATLHQIEKGHEYYEVYTGEDDVAEAGVYYAAAGETQIDVWRETEYIDGTRAGSLFGPYQDKDGIDEFDLWVNTLKRSLRYVKSSTPETTVNELDTYRFDMDDNLWKNQESVPANAKYYAYGPDGFLNLGPTLYGATVQGITIPSKQLPLWMSKPHFLDADEEVLEDFEEGSFQPSAEEHGSWVNVEILTGAGIENALRFQSVARVDPGQLTTPRTALGKSSYLPMFWVDVHVTIDDEQAEGLKLLHTVLKNSKSFAVLGFVVFVVFMGIAAVCVFRHRRRMKQKQQLGAAPIVPTAAGY